MHPVLFHIFSFPIHSYGLMLALSFLLGIWISTVRAKKAGLDPNVIADVGFYVIIAAILGSRLYYVFLHFEEFRSNLLDIINPFQNGSVGIGGLVMYGGFIGALLAGVIYFKLKKVPFLPYADAIAPSIGLGIAITRIGCFLNGCCYGAPSHAHYPLSVNFPEISPAGAYQHAMEAAGLYPSQIFESIGGLIIAIIIFAMGKRKPFEGFQLYLVGILYAILRFMIDFSRYYGQDERLGGLSHNQIVCIALFIIFLGLTLKEIIQKNQKANSTPSANSTSETPVSSSSNT